MNPADMPREVEVATHPEGGFVLSLRISGDAEKVRALFGDYQTAATKAGEFCRPEWNNRGGSC